MIPKTSTYKINNEISLIEAEDSTLFIKAKFTKIELEDTNLCIITFRDKCITNKIIIDSQNSMIEIKGHDGKFSNITTNDNKLQSVQVITGR